MRCPRSGQAGDISPEGPTDLPKNRRSHPPPERLADLGTEWLRSGRPAVLLVPSAVVLQERNASVSRRHRHPAAEAGVIGITVTETKRAPSNSHEPVPSGAAKTAPENAIAPPACVP